MIIYINNENITEVGPFYNDDILMHIVDDKYINGTGITKIPFKNGYVKISERYIPLSKSKAVHCDDGPAIYFENDAKCYSFYMDEGMLHCYYKPAVTVTTELGELVEEIWFINGEKKSFDQIKDIIKSTNIQNF